MTKKYLKENDLLAVPFDKGVGICIMRKTDYYENWIKLSTFLSSKNIRNLEKMRNTQYSKRKRESRMNLSHYWRVEGLMRLCTNNLNQ